MNQRTVPRFIQYMIGYASEGLHKTNQAMKYLYNESDTSTLVQQISMLAKYAHYKDANDFNGIPEEMRRKSLDPESVCVSTVTEGRFFSYIPLCTHESINQHVLKYSFQLLFC